MKEKRSAVNEFWLKIILLAEMVYLNRFQLSLVLVYGSETKRIPISN